MSADKESKNIVDMCTEQAKESWITVWGHELVWME